MAESGDPLDGLLPPGGLGVCLDLASGRGAFLARLAALRGASAWLALDRDAQLLAARPADLPGTALAAHAARVPLRDGRCDTVALSFSLHHLPRPGRVLGEALRLLAPDGRLVLAEPLADGLDAWQRLHRDLHHLAARLDRRLGRCHRPTPRLRELSAWTAGLPLAWRTCCWKPPATPPGHPALKGVLETIERLDAELERRRMRDLRRELAALARRIRAEGFGAQTQFLAVGERR